MPAVGSHTVSGNRYSQNCQGWCGLPLKILEESDLLRGPAKEAKRVQDHTIGAIYDVIRGVNEQVGTLASELLAEAAARRAARAGEVHKHRSTASHAQKH